MDPLADKLLIIAALIALVSLNRLAAWVAMVIIAREFAVTVLRMAATQQGVVISASMFGKLKTSVQVAMVLALIVEHGRPAWLDALVYVTVAVTVVSGADYFFGLRRKMDAGAAGARAPKRAGSRSVEPVAHRRVVRRVLARLQLGAARRAGRGARPRRCAGGSSRGSPGGRARRRRRRGAANSSTAMRTISRTQSSTKRGCMWAFSTTSTSSERFISS